MKYKKFVLLEWPTNPFDPYHIKWEDIENRMGKEFIMWLNGQPRHVAQWFLYRKDTRSQLVVEIYKAQFETEFLLKSKIGPLSYSSINT